VLPLGVLNLSAPRIFLPAIMPDRFVPYPSPTLSTGSPRQTVVANRLVDQPTWAPEASLDALYLDPQLLDPSATGLPALTEEEMASFELLCNDYPQSPSFQPLFLPQDAYAPNPSITTCANSNVINHSNLPYGSAAVFGQTLAPQTNPTPPSESRRQLPLLTTAFSPNALPPSPPYTSHPYQQAVQSAKRSHNRQIPSAGEPERLALPAAGDLNVSMCEIIM